MPCDDSPWLANGACCCLTIDLTFVLLCKCSLTLPLPHDLENDGDISNEDTQHWRSISGR
jgi:hypothetical protein